MRSPKKSAKRSQSKTYSHAGVDIAKGDALVEHLKAINPAIGGFGGLFKLPRGLKDPFLVAATDGVGTKLLVAQLAGRHGTIGIDLVAMSVNDLIVCGARPLFFLDYFATGKLKPAEAMAVLDGIVEGCGRAGCPLIGGETAEMPGMYAPGHYDLAGFAVGVVEAEAVIDGRGVRPGDIILGLASDGLHSNGFSLARRVLLPEGAAAARRALRRKLYRTGPTVGEELLRPTRIYVRTVLDMMRRAPILAAAHVTGGGIAGNLVRALPGGVTAWINLDAWTPPPVFEIIAQRGPVDPDEMFRVFNMGIGFILVVRPDAARRIIRRAERLSEKCLEIGWIDRAEPRDPPSVSYLQR